MGPLHQVLHHHRSIGRLLKMGILVRLLSFAKILALLNPYPIYNFLSYHCLSPSSCSFISSISSIIIPENVIETLDHPRWRQAMIVEMQVLKRNGTWELVPPPFGKKTDGCCWVYSI